MKVSCDACSPRSEHLFSVMIQPYLENTYSELTLDAYPHKYLLASKAIFGKRI